MIEKRNWSLYNEELVSRGRPSKYLSGAIQTAEQDLFLMNHGKVGKPYTYSFIMIFAAFAIKTVNKCGYRQAEGIVADYLILNDIKRWPDFRTIQWRIQQLKKEGIKMMIQKTSDEEDSVDVIIDSTGVRSRKDGDYRSRMYGKMKSWKKIHIAISRKTHKILNMKVTKDRVGDPVQFIPLMKPIVKRRKVNSAAADGAYDSERNFAFCSKNNIDAKIPVHINATGDSSKYRRTVVEEQLGFKRRRGSHRSNWYPNEEKRRESQEKWKDESGYHQRSLVECVIGVFKGVFDECVFSKRKDMIEKELLLKAVVYNTFITNV